MDRLPCKSLLTALCTLIVHHAVVFLLLTRFNGGESQETGQPQPIVAMVGDDITLPCHVKPGSGAGVGMLEWSRPDLNPRFVHVWRSGGDHLVDQNPSYRGRTSVSLDKLKQGDTSLKLSKVKLTDEGTYRCFIPRLITDYSVQLIVGAVINMSTVSSGELECKTKGWYPEPEVLWLDGEGKLLPAGPTETVRGPDDLYTVSSRVTVEKRHSNSFTCRVQQKDINQTRETHIQVPDDFFMVKSSFFPVMIGLAVTSAVSIMVTISLLFFLWKRSQNIKTKRGRWDETDEGQKNNRSKWNKAEVQFSTEVEREQEQLMTEETLKIEDMNKEKVAKRKNHGPSRAELQRKKEEAEQEVETLETKMETKEAEFQTKTTEFGEKEAELKQQRMKNNLQTLEEEHKVETSRASPARSSFLPWKIISRQKLQEEQQRREDAENQVQTLQKELQTQKEELQRNQTETNRKLQQETQRRTEAEREVERLKKEFLSETPKTEMKNKETQLQTKTKELQRNQTEANRKLQQETQRRTEAEREVERLKKESQRERSQASPAPSSLLPWKIISRQKLQEEQQRREDAENQVQTLQKELQTQKEESEMRRAEVLKLQGEKQKLQAKNKQLQRNQTEANRKLQQETQRRTEAEREVERLKKEVHLIIINSLSPLLFLSASSLHDVDLSSHNCTFFYPPLLLH
ncbi:butyrophilin-like protein 1 isoform X2 [Trachinotus anak]|uniref:butyrophilin-like protein 1 isoform X2 n=1 Tax=Trachinotus anak TaxID=443729 RepID=UPI0039F1843A